MAKRNDPEHQEQVQVVDWCVNYPKEIRSGCPTLARQYGYEELNAFFAIPNGGYRPWSEGKKLHEEGVSAGVPDLEWPVPSPHLHPDNLTLAFHAFETDYGGFLTHPSYGRCYYGLYIEMKYGKNTTSPKQKERIAQLKASGYRVEVCYSVDHAFEVACNYLGLPIIKPKHPDEW